ncbi:MAG: hypothetical protein IJA52_08485 [Clostridia bacterium]|nr:hypothetical protein [Clostridia bacterium]
MKKILSIVLLFALVAMLISCGNTNNDKNDKVDSPDTTAANENADTTEKEEESNEAFVCKLSGGYEIVIGEALPDLGDYIDCSEAPSCIHEGMDRVYTYDGYSVTTSPDGKGNDNVSEVSILSDSVLMNDTITIGVSKDTVVSALGEDYTEAFGVMTYEVMNATVSVILDDASNVMSFVVALAQ